MSILAFVVLAGLGIVVLLTYTKRQRNRDRWPYNLDTSSDTPSTASSDPAWSPTTNSLIAAGTLAVLGDDNTPPTPAQPAGHTTDNADSTSCLEPGATGSWGESGDTGGSFDSGGGDGGGGDGGGGDGGGD